MQSLTRHNFATVCSRLTRFSPKCPAKISVYQSNFYQLVENSLINSRNWMLWATSPCMWTWHLWQLINC